MREKICEGKSETRNMQMDKLWWKDLDKEARARSKKEKRRVFAQDILREIAGSYLKKWAENEHAK